MTANPNSDSRSASILLTISKIYERFFVNQMNKHCNMYFQTINTVFQEVIVDIFKIFFIDLDVFSKFLYRQNIIRFIEKNLLTFSHISFYYYHF